MNQPDISVPPAARDTVRVPDHILIREINGEAVILNLRTQTYHGLDIVGAQMLRSLRVTGSIVAAHQNLAGVFDVDPDQLDADLRKLVADLEARGLLEGGPV